jgi:hypothetical protein
MANPRAEEVLARLDIEVAADGTVELCYATTSAAADASQKSGELATDDDAVYFCTSRDTVARRVEPTDGVLLVRVAVDDLIVHRDDWIMDDLLREAERQAEFKCLRNSGANYRPAEVLNFEPVGRDFG